MARVVESRVTNAYKTLNEELGLPASPSLPVSSCHASPRTSNVQTRSDSGLEHLQNRPKRGGLTAGVHPAGFAAACLYKAGRNWGTG